MTDERDLWYGTSGPHDAKIVIVGESWGREELAAKRPFVGPSGQELNRLLTEAGISRYDVLCTNIIAEQPHANETFRFFLPKNSHPTATRVGGLIPSGLATSEMQRLYRQLGFAPRALVIGVGNYALWGLGGKTSASLIRESNGRPVPADLATYVPGGILNWRGSMIYVEPHKNFLPQDSMSPTPLSQTPLLPIVHPAAIIRDWALRSPTLHDLRTRVPKALSGDWRPREPTYTLAPPSFDSAVKFLRHWLIRGDKGETLLLACDIETFRRRFISCIGFADRTFAISIPFITGVESDGSIRSHWTPEQEATIIGLLRRLLLHPQIRISGQNFIYDTQFIQHWLGVTPRLYHDTMLAQNVLFPGTPKDLGYLSSLYCHYHWYWKDDVKDWSKFGNLHQLLDYNCIDAMRTHEIAMRQLDYIKATGQEEQMRFKMRTNDLCLRMMNRGVLIDSARRGSMLFQLQAAEAAFQHELLQIIPQSMVKPHEKKSDKFWYRSAKQTSELLYDVLGMSVVNNRKTGNRTVGKEALVVLERKYPEFTGLFRRLDYLGSVSNTVNVIQTPTEPDGRMRCSYNPGGTETHRLSSSENVFGRGTNLQNLTKGEEDD
jgi:uracil-DNA glycosylase